MADDQGKENDHLNRAVASGGRRRRGQETGGHADFGLKIPKSGVLPPQTIFCPHDKNPTYGPDEVQTGLKQLHCQDIAGKLSFTSSGTVFQDSGSGLLRPLYHLFQKGHRLLDKHGHCWECWD
jgi:hypothetical protein